MDLRNNTLRNLLTENQQETQKWEKYREEQISVKSNISEFQNKLEIDVLVPIGTKAFVPGVLYHTNEILVSHFQGYFSKVTANTALVILNHRLKLANNHIQKLEEEYKLFEPKLNLPNEMTEDGQEIIEEYDEETERKWRVQHRENVRKMKLEEKYENSAIKEDVINILEELELMEELEELDRVEPESNETNEKLMQLISGEIKLVPEKERVSHCKEAAGKINISQVQVDGCNRLPSVILDESKPKNEVLKDESLQEISGDRIDEQEDYDNIPLEIRNLVESTNNLNITDKIKIFKKKLKSVKASLRTMKIKTEIDLEEKLANLEIKETLEEIIEDMENIDVDDEEGDELKENETEDEEIQIDVSVNQNPIMAPPSKRKYTFNENVDICYINSKDPPRKISDDRKPILDESELDRRTVKDIDISLVKPKIDYDPATTFFIRFNHAIKDDVPIETDHTNELVENFVQNVISSPYEIYKSIKHKTDCTITRKGKKGKHTKLIADVPLPIENEKPLKSILKPGLVMNYESFSQIDEEEFECREQIDEQSCNFNKIMGEVTEHSTAIDQQYNSAAVSHDHIPKISKFKQTRKKN